MKLSVIITIFSGVIFIFYGINCFRSDFLKTEFARFGLANKRKLTGGLQIFGGISLLLGLYASNELAFIAASGLCTLMFLGFGVRLKVKDSIMQSAPSLLLGILNLYLAIFYFAISKF